MTEPAELDCGRGMVDGTVVVVAGSVVVVAVSVVVGWVVVGSVVVGSSVVGGSPDSMGVGLVGTLGRWVRSGRRTAAAASVAVLAVPALAVAAGANAGATTPPTEPAEPTVEAPGTEPVETEPAAGHLAGLPRLRRLPRHATAVADETTPAPPAASTELQLLGQFGSGSGASPRNGTR